MVGFIPLHVSLTDANINTLRLCRSVSAYKRKSISAMLNFLLRARAKGWKENGSGMRFVEMWVRMTLLVLVSIKVLKFYFFVTASS